MEVKISHLLALAPLAAILPHGRYPALQARRIAKHDSSADFAVRGREPRSIGISHERR